MIVGGGRLIFPHLLTTKVQKIQPWIRSCVCGEPQVAATASKGALLGKVSFLVSRLPEAGAKGAYMSCPKNPVSPWLSSG